MQKVHFVWFVILLNAVVSGCARSASSFTGKWEITVAQTPEVKFTTDLVRKQGRLIGELTDARNPDSPKFLITKVDEKGNSMSIYYRSGEGKEQFIDLTRVDADNLTGTMYTFDASAKRIR